MRRHSGSLARGRERRHHKLDIAAWPLERVTRSELTFGPFDDEHQRDGTTPFPSVPPTAFPQCVGSLPRRDRSGQLRDSGALFCVGAPTDIARRGSSPPRGPARTRAESSDRRARRTCRRRVRPGHRAARSTHYPAGAAGWRRVAVPTLGTLISGFLRYRFFPDARGSGIPQTKRRSSSTTGKSTFRRSLASSSAARSRSAAGSHSAAKGLRFRSVPASRRCWATTRARPRTSPMARSGRWGRSSGGRVQPTHRCRAVLPRGDHGRSAHADPRLRRSSVPPRPGWCCICYSATSRCFTCPVPSRQRSSSSSMPCSGSPAASDPWASSSLL